MSPSDVIETSIEEYVDEVDPLMPHDEKVGFLLNGRESSHYKQIDSKESINFLEREDVKVGLGSILLLTQSCEICMK